MPLVTIDGSETPAENVGKSIPRASLASLDTFTKERRIWPGSIIALESFVNSKMKAARVFYGEATESLSINLDPGWYRYKCTATDDYGETHQFVNQFLVQITPDMFKLYSAMRPKYSKGRQTSSGVRWSCGFSNCKRAFTSMYAIIDHEKRHEGETIFRRIPWKPEGCPIVILGGMPEGVEEPVARKAVLPPMALMDEMESEAMAEAGIERAAPKRRGRKPGSKNRPKAKPEEAQPVHA